MLSQIGAMGTLRVSPHWFSQRESRVTSIVRESLIETIPLDLTSVSQLLIWQRLNKTMESVLLVGLVDSYFSSSCLDIARQWYMHFIFLSQVCSWWSLTKWVSSDNIIIVKQVLWPILRMYGLWSQEKKWTHKSFFLLDTMQFAVASSGMFCFRGLDFCRGPGGRPRNFSG